MDHWYQDEMKICLKEMCNLRRDSTVVDLLPDTYETCFPAPSPEEDKSHRCTEVGFPRDGASLPTPVSVLLRCEN